MAKTFADLEVKIRNALQEKIKEAGGIPGEKSFSLIEGFIIQPLSRVSNVMSIGTGPTLPSIAVVGETTGRIYYFALKALLSEEEI